MKKFIFIVLILFIFKSTNLIAKTHEFYTFRFDEVLCKISTKGDLVEIGKVDDEIIGYFGFEYIDFIGECFKTHGNKLYKVNIQTGELTEICTLKSMDGTPILNTFLSFNKNDEIYILDGNDYTQQGKLYKLENLESGNLIELNDSRIGVKTTLGMEFDDSGNLWSLDKCCNHALNKIDTKTGEIVKTIKLSDEIFNPTDLDFVDGEMYFLDLDYRNKNYTYLKKVNLNNGIIDTIYRFDGFFSGLSSYFPLPKAENKNCENVIFNYENFSDLNSLNLVQDAVEYDGILRLTKSENFKSGAIWYNNYVPVNSSFQVSYSFRFNEGKNSSDDENSSPGADGITFLIQNDNSNKIGNSGGGIGYEGLKNAIAFELDLYQNTNESYSDPNGNHFAIFHSKNNISANHNSFDKIYERKYIPKIKIDNTEYKIEINYDNNKKNLKVHLIFNNNKIEIGNLNNFDISELIDLENKQYAYVGIAGATGTSSQRQEVLNWRFCLLEQVQSINEYESTISIHPNPAKNFIIINNEYANSEINIYDILGNEYICKKIGNQIDLNNLVSGIYFVKFKNDKQISYQKIIVEK